jgi:ribosomal protein S18 acetylase RimI-like enzyme
MRDATERDAPRLSRFNCSRGAIHEDEVQQFVRQQAIGWMLATKREHRLFVVLEQARLIAVAGCSAETLLIQEDDVRFRSKVVTRLQVLALSLKDQGRTCSDGRRISDLVIASLMTEALGANERHTLTALVAKDNLRSIALLERHGLRSQIEHDARHLRMSGHFARRG